jgi:hypothetical protein
LYNNLLEAPEVAKKSVEEEFKKISIKGGELAMTTGEKLRKEGRLEGRIVRRIEGERALLRKIELSCFYEKQMSIDAISDLLPIDTNQVEAYLKELN